ncbi:restriction endonuclease subunit S [Brumimicrobium salinarum]|uniref:restriction endonuclease subunit S n=1 Tax=Brumimicrobium salinarum TaxID=2058658 RepID=UPI0013FD5AE8|nr:restriction endonuclease subunit S [Brumimicrobium salinarum]
MSSVNEIPNGWMETTLGEVIDIKHGFAFKGKYISEVPNNNILVTPGNFSLGGGFKSEKFKYYYGDIPEDYILNADDIIVTMTDLSKEGDTLGYSALVPNGNKIYLHNQRIGLVIFKNEDFDKKFAYWLLRTRHYQKSMVNSSTGSTVSHTSPSRIQEYEFNLPPIPEQKAIANILTAFDDKIENLQAQNLTLEQTAQTIFAAWFGKYQVGDELPDGWRVGKLGEEFKITMGQSPSGSSYNEEEIGIVFFQGRAEFTSRFPDIRLYTTEPKRMANKFDILVSVRAPVGDINVAHTNCCIGRGLAAVSSEYKSYVLYKLKSLKPIFDLFESEGTVFGSINKTSLENIETIIPEIKKIEEFDTISSKIDLKIYNNHNQIQTLKKTRDTLLPKLMSGQLRINEFKE